MAFRNQSMMQWLQHKEDNAQFANELINVCS